MRGKVRVNGIGLCNWCELEGIGLCDIEGFGEF